MTAVSTRADAVPTAGGTTRGPLARLLRGRQADPAWVRPALLALLAATAALYLAGLSRNGWANDFYSAAVQAGTRSWKAFLFGSFDSANFITVDKAPASLWVMELSARAFGLNYWSVLVPQALEGVAAVAALYATVRRWHGPAAGLVAGAVMAVTPVAALIFRFNNPDALLVLVMVLAAYATVRAVETGLTRWLALAGALLGLGFLTKMLQVFLVLPAFALAYLVAGPPRLGRRIVQLLAGGAAMLAAAGWWIAVVLLTPAADRPYVGGSTTNSILQLTFGYNGLGRLDGRETGSVGFGNGSGPAFGGPAGLGRLFGSEMGGQASWLIPAALIALAALAWLSFRARGTGRERAAVLLWGGWLVVTGLVFSHMSGIIHPYYTVALAPPTGALAGVGAVALWRRRQHPMARATLAAMIAVTAAWAWVLLERSPGWHPWLRVAVAAAAAVSACAVLAWPRLAGARGRAAGPVRLAVAGLTGLAVLAGPAAYSLDTAAAAHTGALPSAGPAVVAAGGPGGGFGVPGGFGRPAGAAGAGPGATPGGFAGSGPPGARGGSGRRTSQAGRTGGQGTAVGTGGQGTAGRAGGAGSAGGFGGPGGLAGNTRVSASLTRLLTAGAAGYTWAAATVGSESAAPLQLASGEPVMAIGGFNGSDPAPTLAAFIRLVAEHKIHYFVGQNQASFGGGAGSAARITSWVRAHFTSSTVGGLTVYDLSAAR